MNPRDYYPGQITTNQETLEHIARMVNGDICDAIDAALSEIENVGWKWIKTDGYHGSVVDTDGNQHNLWAAQSFAEAVAMAFRLMQDYRKLGWI